MVALLLLSVSASAAAAEPTIRNVDLRGLQLGGTTTIAIDGENFGSEPRLLLNLHGVEIQRQPDSTDKRAVFAITLPALGAIDAQAAESSDDRQDIAPGYVNLRLATDEGCTPPILVAVDQLPEARLGPAGAPPVATPIALHGALSGSTVVEASFEGEAGQRVVIEVEAQRLGGGSRPVLHLYDARRRQIGWAWPQRSLAGDARLTATLPAAGMYFVTLHDMEYAAPAPPHFRLKIGDWTVVEQAFPPAVQRGQTAALQLLGDGPPVAISFAPPAIDRTAPAPRAEPAAGSSSPLLASGLRPVVEVSDIPELLTQPPAAEGATAAVQELPADGPLAISGLLKRGEEARFRLPVASGSKWRFEVFCERLGSRCDAALVLQNEQGQTLVRGEDGPGTTDPLLEYTAPDTLAALHLVVSGRSSDERAAVYRLRIEPQSASSGNTAGDFRLWAAFERLHAPQDGRTVCPVWVERLGYRGPIELQVDGLPAGVTVQGTDIPADCGGTLLTFASASAERISGGFSIIGRDPQGAIVRSALHAAHPLSATQPWLASELALAAVAPSPLSIDWHELPEDFALSLLGRTPFPVQVVRPEGAATAIRLTLLASQLPPKNANGQPDLPRTIRFETANIEMAPDKSDAAPVVLTPAELAGAWCDVAVQAELLSADKRTVLAAAVTPVRRLAVVNPIGVELAGEPQLSATIDPRTGAAVKVQGQIVRRAGFEGDVVVSLADVPAGVRTAPVTVKAGETEFAIDVQFPPSFKTGTTSLLKLSGLAAVDSKQPNLRVKSNEMEIAVTLAAPPAEDAK